MSLEIRLATEADAGGMLEIYAPVVLNTTISSEEQPPSEEEFRGRIRYVLDRFPWLVCTEGDSVVGYAYAAPFRTRAGYRWTAELAIYIHPAHHRRGVGRALYTALLQCLSIQGCRMAVGVIALPNEASVGLHESMGFHRTGTWERIYYKFGEWIDDGVWQLDLAPSLDVPAEPRALSEVVGTPEWSKALESGAALLRS